MRISDWSSDVCSSDLCRLGRTQHTQQRLDRARARTATPTVEIEFEIAVAARHVHYRRDGFDGQRRAAEIRVQDDAAGVDRAAQGALPAPRQTLRREDRKSTRLNSSH